MATRATNKSTAKKTPAKAKKLSVSIDPKTHVALTEYIAETGLSIDAFVERAVLEKISRDKIGTMLDSVITIHS